MIESTGQGIAGMASSQMCARLKTFEEMTDAEKIAYLGTEMKSLRGFNQYLARKVEALERHEHGARGQVLVPLDMVNQASGQLGRY